jgi:perosamine synthetase
MTRIFYTKPSITQLEIEYASDAAATGWGIKCYDYIDQFEKAFCDHLGVKFALATSSCTGAIHLGFAASGIGAGDEVIMADINWIASAAPIVHLGATPIFVDVLADSWCLDPEKVEQAITPKTKAILAVHLYGNIADIKTLQAIADRHGLLLIEDAAEAIGSKIDGVAAGSMGHFGTFSFHGTKTVTTGEGGMFVTQDEALFERVLTLNNHGRARGQKKQFWAEQVGFKYKMSNVQAAIGCAQMTRIDSLITEKRRVFETYRDLLVNLPLSMNPEPEMTTNGYWMPTVVVNDDVMFDRDRLLNAFQANDIDGRVFFWPLSSLPMFERQEKNIVSYGLHGRSFNLPSYHDLSSDDISRVCNLVRQCLE